MSSRDEMVQMAGYGEEKLSTVLITGSVVCNKACLAAKHGNHHLQLPPQPISGALVGAECQANKKVKSPSWAKAVTDEYGEFMIELPSNLHGIPNLDKKCSVKILKLPKDSPCHPSTIKNKEIKLSSVGNGIRTYTTGKIELLNIMPEKSEACMKGQKDEQGMSW
uniref:Pollen Ole e 1 allergen and extensin family protein n=2 Tax=Chenopodium quinoa TaxID=63459 RepID=A0A803M1I4_CHEQI